MARTKGVNASKDPIATRLVDSTLTRVLRRPRYTEAAHPEVGAQSRASGPYHSEYVHHVAA